MPALDGATLKSWRNYNNLSQSNVAILFGAYASSAVAMTATDIASFENGSRTMPAVNICFTNLPQP